MWASSGSPLAQTCRSVLCPRQCRAQSTFFTVHYIYLVIYWQHCSTLLLI
jgi:hypothetical protein